MGIWFFFFFGTGGSLHKFKRKLSSGLSDIWNCSFCSLAVTQTEDLMEKSTVGYSYTVIYHQSVGLAARQRWFSIEAARILGAQLLSPGHICFSFTRWSPECLSFFFQQLLLRSHLRAHIWSGDGLASQKSHSNHSVSGYHCIVVCRGRCQRRNCFPGLFYNAFLFYDGLLNASEKLGANLSERTTPKGRCSPLKLYGPSGKCCRGRDISSPHSKNQPREVSPQLDGVIPSRQLY